MPQASRSTDFGLESRWWDRTNSLANEPNRSCLTSNLLVTSWPMILTNRKHLEAQLPIHVPLEHLVQFIGASLGRPVINKSGITGPGEMLIIDSVEKPSEN